jgi:hypothetical protein
MSRQLGRRVHNPQRSAPNGLVAIDICVEKIDQQPSASPLKSRLAER